MMDDGRLLEETYLPQTDLGSLKMFNSLDELPEGPTVAIILVLEHLHLCGVFCLLATG